MSAPTLAEAVRTIPAECYERPAWKGLAVLLRDLAIGTVLVWALLRTDSPLLLILLWAVAGSTISGLFVLGHDAAHGSLFASPRLCKVAGQLAMLPSLHALSVWAYGHNRIHHRFAGCEGLDFVWHPLTPEQYAQLSRLARLLHRIEWSGWGTGLYYLRALWWGKIVRGEPPARLAREFRRDRTIVALFFVCATAALLWSGYRGYGSAAGAAWTWAKVFAVPWLVWNTMIGWAVYIHHIAPDVQWYPRRLWSKFRGQVEGGTIYRLPDWLNLFWHNIFVHVPHHVDERIPFYHLPRAAAALEARYGARLRCRSYRLRDYTRIARRCKLYDFERGRWTDYRGRPADPFSHAAPSLPPWFSSHFSSLVRSWSA